MNVLALTSMQRRERIERADPLATDGPCPPIGAELKRRVRTRVLLYRGADVSSWLANH